MNTDPVRPALRQQPDAPLFPSSIAANGFLFVSGQASVGEAGIVPGAFAEEMGRAIANLRRALAEAGLTFDDIVKLTAYVDDPNDLAEYNALYPRFFHEPRPARTTLTGCLGGVIKFEVDAIAALPGIHHA